MAAPDAGPWRELPLAPRAWGPGVLAGLVGVGTLGLAWTLGRVALGAEGAPAGFVAAFLMFLALLGGAGAFALVVAAAALAGGARARQVRGGRDEARGGLQLELEERAAFLRKRRRFPHQESWVSYSEDGLVVHGPGGARWEAPSLAPSFGREEASRWATSLDLELGPERRARREHGLRWQGHPEAWLLEATGWTAGPWVLAGLGACFLTFAGGVGWAGLTGALPMTPGSTPILGVFGLAGVLLLLSARGRARLRRTLTLSGRRLRLQRPPWPDREAELAQGEVRCVSPRRPGSSSRGPLWALEVPTPDGPVHWSLPCGAEGHRSAARWIERARRAREARDSP